MGALVVSVAHPSLVKEDPWAKEEPWALEGLVGHQVGQVGAGGLPFQGDPLAS